MKMKNSILTLAALSAAFSLGAHQISGPDGRLTVDVISDGGKPVYSVKYDGKDFTMPSPLGLVTDYGDFTSGMELTAATPVEAISESYSLPNIKKSHVDYSANRSVYTFSKDGKPVYEVEFRVSPNDVAFRYNLLPQGERRCAIVKDEATSFVMPGGTTTFLCPQSGPMGGFARTSPSYETSYKVDEATGKNGWGNGYTFPCLFRNGDNGWTLVSETGVGANYCGGRLMGGNGDTYRMGQPQPGEMNGYGSVNPALPLPSSTPWRTLTVGQTLAPIVETTVPYDVVTPLYEPSQKYDYTRGTWSWIIGMDGWTTYDVQKRYIDFAADLGYETVLVDALWDTQIGYDKMEELARYAKEKGVGLYLWYNSNGSWNDAPQGPRGRMDSSLARHKEMKWMKENGIKGIKVDFFGGDKQEMLKVYEDILADANEYGIMVIFHGCTLPRGWERMYPNYASSEAVLASENFHWGQGSCDTEAFCATLHPFIRNTVGAMDFGGSALNRYHNSENTPGHGTVRRTSDVFALATAVLFQSPVQHFSLAPNNLTDAPAWAIGFMKSVPSTWDDVRFIDGYPGKYIVLARRHGDKWYIAGVNGSDTPVELKLNLPMFGKGDRLTLYTDNDKLEGDVREVKLGKELKVKMPVNGAFLAVGSAD